METQTSVVHMEHVHKQFSGVSVLDDVSFDLRRGEVHHWQEETVPANRR